MGQLRRQRDPDSPLCLLLYDSKFHLMGHAVGAPEAAGDGQWQLEVTLCDYDFTDLYEEQLAPNSNAQREETFANYIVPEDIEDSGAKYFLTGYNTGRGPTLLPGDSQAYHLWAQYTSALCGTALPGDGPAPWTGFPGMTGGAASCSWMRTISCWATP